MKINDTDSNDCDKKQKVSDSQITNLLFSS